VAKDRRFHRGFTAAQKTELWDRWKRGESLKAIGRAFGKPSSSIYFLVAPHGGIGTERLDHREASAGEIDAAAQRLAHTFFNTGLLERAAACRCHLREVRPGASKIFILELN
jgi:hypothetical protein